MGRYKVLSLQFPFTLSDKMWEKLGVSEDPSGTPISPIFKRHGWYYDRKTRTSWIECSHGCWQESTPEMFLYYLENENHVALPKKVMLAIKTLMNYGMCPKELVFALRKERDIRDLIDTKRGHHRAWIL